MNFFLATNITLSANGETFTYLYYYCFVIFLFIIICILFAESRIVLARSSIGFNALVNCFCYYFSFIFCPRIWQFKSSIGDDLHLHGHPSLCVVDNQVLFSCYLLGIKCTQLLLQCTPNDFPP